MSTKTSIKRIALVAVAALGFGMVSTVSANAGAVQQDATITGVTDGTTAHGVSVQYSKGATITATINVATATTMSASGDYIGADVTVTGPTVGSATTISATTGTVSYTLTAAAATATLTSAATATNLTGSWVSGTSTSAQALGTVSFVASLPGVYKIVATPIESKIGGTVSSSSTKNAATTYVTVGGNVPVPTVALSATVAGAATGQAGGYVTYRFQPKNTATTIYFAKVDSGSIASVTNSSASGTTGTMTPTNAFTNGTNSADGFKLTNTLANTWNSGGAVGTAAAGSYWDIQITNATAGTTTLTLSSYDSTTGAITAVGTGVTTWVAAASTAISAANSSVGIVDTAAHCVAGANKTADETQLATYAVSSLYYKSVPSDTSKAFLCAIFRDGNGLAITTSPTMNIVTSGGALGATAGTGHTSATAFTDTNNADGSYSIELSGDTLTTGSVTINMTAIDSASNAISKSTTFTFFGKLATLELTQVGYSIAYGSSTPTYAYAKGATAKDIQVAQVVGKDAGGNVIDFDQTSASGNPTISKITVDSSGTTGAPSRGASDSLGATASVATDGYYGAGYGFYGLFVNCYNSSAAEKLTVSVSGLKSDGVTYADSASIDVYCSKLSTTTTALTVTPAATEVAAGGTTTVDVAAKDVNGYPLADGVTISMAASNGAALTNASPITKNGVLKLAPTLAAGSNGPISITAVYGSVSATGSVTVTGSQTADAIDAANEATDAANAATDAANAAAEAADAATAAAQDAQAAVAALATSVSTLIAGIKAQITTLTNLVIKIQKKVRA